MSVFNFLLGHWDGIKTSFDTAGNPVKSRSTDRGRFEAGGSIFTIAGQTFDPDASQPSMENFGVFFFDVATGEYRLNTYVGGATRQCVVELIDGGALRAWPQGNDGSIRLTLMPGNADSWNELGEIREADGTWRTLFQMEFSRAG